MRYAPKKVREGEYFVIRNNASEYLGRHNEPGATHNVSELDDAMRFDSASHAGRYLFALGKTGQRDERMALDTVGWSISSVCILIEEV